ncbi:dynein axonemal heavy chain 7-like [Condylostylus longicornis]|uniref:dynein axonemal heavy chain 7-like n=1 Tax=Condylostylus longicornis TaxID=2530218 RepID=UPI00244E011A|nr:dynein axonemal heavy chain 7-like [Condylostylus longicornis]
MKIISCYLMPDRSAQDYRKKKEDIEDPVANTNGEVILADDFNAKGFSKDFDPCIDEIVSATLKIHRSAKSNLLPTPCKSHYIFNLRDFSKVIQGVLLSVPEATEDLNSMRRLWVHEVLRVYHDRLVDEFDKEWFFLLVKQQIISNMDIKAEILFERFLGNKIQLERQDLRPLIFCDFTNPKADTRNYIEVQDLDDLRNVVETYLVEFNNMSKKPMQLVLFRFSIEHLAKISRIIKQPRSHALLIGVGGSGRQSLTKLAAHICDYELFQVELTQQYRAIDWQDNIKNILLKISSTDTHGVFLFSDSQAKLESFLEDINNLLNSGEVPNLFSNEEKVELCEKMKQIDRQRDKSIQTDGSAASLYNFFVQVCIIYKTKCFNTIEVVSVLQTDYI